MGHPEKPPTSEGVVIPGLTIAHCGHKTYVGVLKARDENDEFVVTLEDVLELAVERGVTREGQVQERVLPVTVFPFQTPAPSLKLRAHCVIPAAEDPRLGNLYRAASGRSGLHIPGIG